MNRRYLIAIIICGDDNGARKYHDIMNTEQKISAFMRFCSNVPGARYVNFYFKTDTRAEKGRNFAFRRYING